MTQQLPATDEQLNQLLRLLDVSEGTSSFALAECDDSATRDTLIRELQADRTGIALVPIPPQTVDVFGVVLEAGLPERPAAIFVVGLEDSALGPNGPHTWKSLNASRDLWREQFPCPVVFWLPAEATRQFPGQAPDFWRFIAHQVIPFASDRFSVFISYSHNDEKWRKQLETQLRPILYEAKIDAWSDTRIQAGQDWQTEIEQALDVARIGVLLVSEHFLASDFIRNVELPFLLRAAEERRLTLVWVLLNHCAYEATPLAHIQAAHDTKKPLQGLAKAGRAKVLTDVARQIRQLADQARNRGEIPHEPGTFPHAFDLEIEDRIGRSAYDHGRDDFLARVAEICKLRYPNAQITRLRDGPTRLTYLRVVLPEGRFFVPRPIAAFQHGVLPATLDQFADLLNREYRATDPGVLGEIVYGGDPVPDAQIDDAWKRHHVLLTSFVEYQSIVDFRPYVRQQSKRLESDAIYPPKLYVT